MTAQVPLLPTVWECLKPAWGSQPETAAQSRFIRSFQGLPRHLGVGARRAWEGGTLHGTLPGAPTCQGVPLQSSTPACSLE